MKAQNFLHFLSRFVIINLLSLSLALPENFSAEDPAKKGQTFDFLIKDAMVFDGVRFSGFRADVGIRGDRIAEVGDLRDREASQLINGKDLVLAPGFIDTHTHSDFNPTVYPDLENKLLQGVTTEIVGNCGMSAAPIIGPHAQEIRKVWSREGVAIPKKLAWTTYAEYRSRLESKGLNTNFAGLAGHGNIRSAVMGLSPQPASQSNIEDMKKILSQAMAEGAIGISFGLVYLPGIYAKEDEIVELCREAARHSGICAFHMRSESAELLESIEEVIEIAKKAQAGVQISHLKAAGKANWPKIDEAILLMDRARLDGVRLAADVYPYTASFAELGVILPDDLFERKDREAYFKDPANREEILAKLRGYYEGKMMKWDTVMIATTARKSFRTYEGKTIKEIATEKNQEAERVLVDILAGNSFEVSAYTFSQSPEVVDKVLKYSYSAIGSDSIADGSRRPHPRAWGTFPKVLRETVSERKLLQMGDAIRKMTALPAEHFRLKDRGKIQPGYYADLVLFDPQSFTDPATYQEPKAPAKGVEWVFVNGEPAVQKGKVVGRRSGRFLKLEF